VFSNNECRIVLQQQPVFSNINIILAELDFSTEGTEIFPPTMQAGITPSIEASSVCSTTSDQDPTLLPVTAANVLKTVETRRRRGSVAIWSDPGLVALANRAMKPTKAEPEESKLKAQPMVPDFSFQTGFPGDGRLVSFNEEILGLIVDHMDFATLIQFSTVSKKCRDFIQHNDKIIHSVNLSHLNKRVTDSAAEMIVKLVGSRARELNLSQCFYITDEGFKTLIENMPNIESMDLNSCWLLTDKSLSLLAASCPRLVKLDLSNCRKISDGGIFRLLDEKSSRGYPELTEISLSYCKKLSDMTMSHLAEFCSKTLSSLNIQRCTRITDQGFVKWADTHFPQLKSLNLTDCSFLTDQAISHLVSAAPNLNSLSLSFCCALSDSAIEGLISLSELQDLDASFCGAAVSDLSIRALLNSNSSESMNSLNLRGCVRITDTCIKTILELGRLNTLNISQCPGISLDAKQTIKESGNVHHLVA
jgi:F-box/leucine-rich repeat protein 7